MGDRIGHRRGQNPPTRLAAASQPQAGGVIQELYGLLLAHYAVRSLMHEAALKAAVDPDRLSFTHCVRVIGDAMAEFEMVAVGERRRLYGRLLRDLAAELLPERRLRINPRVVKRKMPKAEIG